VLRGHKIFGASIHIVDVETRRLSVLSHRKASTPITSSSIVSRSGTVSLLNAKAANGNTLKEELAGT
jgi:hypothetical protein